MPKSSSLISSTLILKSWSLGIGAARDGGGADSLQMQVDLQYTSIGGVKLAVGPANSQRPARSTRQGQLAY